MAFGPHLLLAMLEGLVTAAVLALTALGLSLVFGVMRIVNVAHGEFFMLGAVLAWAFASLLPGHPALGFLVALVVSPLIVGGDRARRRAPGPAPAELQSGSDDRRHDRPALHHPAAGAHLLRARTRGRSSRRSASASCCPGSAIPATSSSVIAASALLLTATWLVLTRTRLGLVMRATQYDRETAQAFGIPVERVYAAVFALGAMLAAVAAVLIVPIQQAHYLMGLDPLLLSFIVVIIGGLGSSAARWWRPC